MGEYFKKHWFALVLFLVVIFVGNKLRSFSYATVPAPGETADEYSFAWVGLSLIKDRYPIAWSGLSAYPSHDFQKINIDGLFDLDPHRPLFSIDKPWFDHPPLFGMITGGYSYLKGARNFVDTGTYLIRRPMLKIALITTLALYLLAEKLFGTNIGLLASALYSLAPTYIVSSRLALAENGYIPLFLLAILFGLLYFDNKRLRYWLIAITLAAIALLIKLSAISIFMSLFLLVVVYAKTDKKRLITLLLLLVILPLFVFILYGLQYDLGIFIKVFIANGNRFYGASSEVFFQAITGFKITSNKFLTDGWVILGWISFFVIAISQFKKSLGGTVLTLVMFSTFIVFILFGSESYGWYKFPFFPFLIISSAKVILDLIKKRNIFALSGLVLLPIGTAIHRMVGVFGFQSFVPVLRLSVILLFLVFVLSLVVKTNKVKMAVNIFMIAVLALAFYLSIKEVYFLTAENWIAVT